MRLGHLCPGCLELDLCLHAVHADQRGGNLGSQLGDFLFSGLECDQLRIGADLLGIELDDVGVGLHHLRIELDEGFILVKTVFEDGQALEGVCRVAHEGGDLGLDGLGLVANGHFGEPMADIVALDVDDAGGLHGGVGQADGHQVTQADDLMLIAGDMLHVLDGGLHRAGGLLDLLEILPGLCHQLGGILRALQVEDGGVPAVLFHGLRVFHPGLPQGLVHRITGGNGPAGFSDGEVAGFFLRACCLAHAVEPCDGRRRADDVDIAGILAALQDAAPEDGLVLFQMDDAACDLPGGKDVVGDDAPLIQLHVGRHHIPGGVVVSVGLFQTVRLRAGDLPCVGGAGCRHQAKDCILEPHVQLLMVLDDGLLQLLDDGIRGGDGCGAPVVRILRFCDGKEAEVAIHAHKADVIAVAGLHVRPDGGAQAIVGFVMHQLRHAGKWDDAAHPLGWVKEVDGHMYSSFQVALIRVAWSHRMLRLPGLRALQKLSGSVTV